MSPTVYVNDCPLELAAGMSVRHALIRAGRLHEVERGLAAYDEWGNELGLDGALSEGMKIYLK